LLALAAASTPLRQQHTSSNQKIIRGTPVNKLLTRLLSGLLFSVALTTANATVIGFNSGLDPTFTYSSDITYKNAPVTGTSGYDNLAAYTGGYSMVFNSSEASPSNFYLAGSSSATFILNSFVIAGAWGNQTLTIVGSNNGVQLFSQLLAVSVTPTVFSAGWAGIDQLTIKTGTDFLQTASGGNGQHWALDQLTINESNRVPEPASLAIACLGLAALVATRGKKRA
jgi:hypothetical protein